MRTTIAQKLARRQAHTPGIIYSLLVKLVMPILSKKLSPTFTYKAFPGKDEGPFVLISNHASRIDYLYTAPYAGRASSITLSVTMNSFSGRPALRWDDLVEEMHRFAGGKWQNTEYRHV